MNESVEQFAEPLAHSQKKIGDEIIPVQSYKKHIYGVFVKAKNNTENLLPFFQDSNKQIFAEFITMAALFHDLGKLDELNQKVLSGRIKAAHLPINHVDAGVAWLLKQKLIESAVIAYGHHLGLLSKPNEMKKSNNLFLRDPEIKDQVDANLESFIKLHQQFFPQHNQQDIVLKKLSGLERRIGLSCLVDADHGDTAKNYLQEKDILKIAPKWEERLNALDNYVLSITCEMGSERNRLRSEIYNACRNAKVELSLRSCDSPVGTGKTTAVMAYLLNVAREKKLRHIIVVLPFTNIIKQSVDVYRKALVLPGENPEEVVAEHHHQADFSDFSARHLASLWNTPIIVTTAVQFFETIAGNYPSHLRKLHELPGSAVFIDEAHAAIPVWHWTQQWHWLKELSEKWSCHFVFASGSLARFWHIKDIIEYPEKVPDIVPEEIKEKAVIFENKRIQFETRAGFIFDRARLISEVISRPGPRLVILNTVQSAAVLANEMSVLGYDVLHLSTALAPVDRDRIVKFIQDKLTKDKDWTLVATSCVEAGMDFSFMTAFRESCSLSSLIQTGGRVNRHGEITNAKVVDFRIQDELFNSNRSFTSSRKVLADLLKEGSVLEMNPGDAITIAMKEEIKLNEISSLKNQIVEAERIMDYPEVTKLCRVIDSDSKLVVVYKEIVKKIESGEFVSPQELVRHSVQIRAHNINKFALEPIKGMNNELYSLGSYQYDRDFLGYMKGILPQIYAKSDLSIIA